VKVKVKKRKKEREKKKLKPILENNWPFLSPLLFFSCVAKGTDKNKAEKENKKNSNKRIDNKWLTQSEEK
jgi:hypothetical protein